MLLKRRSLSPLMSARPRCKDVDAVLDILTRHISKPDSLVYRESLTGPSDPLSLKMHSELLRELRAGPCQDGSLTQNCAMEAFAKLAKMNEQQWRLAHAAKAFAVSAAKMLRAMLRDYGQAILKLKDGRAPPKWMESSGSKPVTATSSGSKPVAATSSGSKPVAAATSDADELAHEDAEDDKPLHTLFDDDEEGEEGEEEDKTYDAEVEVELDEAKESTYSFGWDDYMKTAYRLAPGSKNKEFCKTMTAPKGASDADDCVATWADGVVWSVPTMTVGELKQAATQSKEQAIWEGKLGDSTLTLKPSQAKDKRWPVTQCREPKARHAK